MENMMNNFYQFLKNCVEDIGDEKLGGKLSLAQIEDISNYILNGNKRSESQCQRIQDTMYKLVSKYLNDHNIVVEGANNHENNSYVDDNNNETY